MGKKRFIAGAVCPSCKQMDTLQIFTSDAGELIKECIECDFTGKMISEPGLKGELPEARISREELVLEDNVDIVRIINPLNADGD